MGVHTKLAQSRPNSSQARKGIRRGHPELAVECPQCHSPIGRTCFMGSGYWGITHTLRKLRYREGSVVEVRSALVSCLNPEPPTTRQNSTALRKRSHQE